MVPLMCNSNLPRSDRHHLPRHCTDAVIVDTDEDPMISSKVPGTELVFLAWRSNINLGYRFTSICTCISSGESSCMDDHNVTLDASPQDLILEADTGVAGMF
ncbi:hypothetical protein VPH35_044334 [Triticum aestivum]